MKVKKTGTAHGSKLTRRRSRQRTIRAHWRGDDFLCDCGAAWVNICRERVARKVHTLTSHKKRIVAICQNGHKTRIAFPTR